MPRPHPLHGVRPEHRGARPPTQPGRRHDLRRTCPSLITGACAAFMRSLALVPVAGSIWSSTSLNNARGDPRPGGFQPTRRGARPGPGVGLSRSSRSGFRSWSTSCSASCSGTRGRRSSDDDRLPAALGCARSQRATGGFLIIYVMFHVWGTRLSPEVLKGETRSLRRDEPDLEHPRNARSSISRA